AGYSLPHRHGAVLPAGIALADRDARRDSAHRAAAARRADAAPVSRTCAGPEGCARHGAGTFGDSDYVRHEWSAVREHLLRKVCAVCVGDHLHARHVLGGALGLTLRPVLPFRDALGMAFRDPE